MDLWWIAGLAGLASGLSGVVARRAPLLAWVALTPLGIALSTCGWRAALTGALTGACLHGAAMISQPPSLRPLGVGFGAVGWALAAGLAGRVLESLPATALALVLPAVAVLAPLPMRVAGAPRWVHGALACTQEPWPVVIRTGWFGGELTVSGLLGATSAAACLLLPGPASAPLVALLALTIVGALLGLARRSLARTRRAIERLPRVRVAAVVVNGAPPEDAQPDGLWPSRSPEYRDVAAALARYAPRVREAAAAGAALVVLPEAAVVTDGEGARRFTEGARAWAAEHRVTVVAPYVDLSVPTNTLCVAEPSGSVWHHDKQHPVRGLEPPPRVVGPPGSRMLATGLRLSTVLCVDLDYADLVAPMRSAGGLLVAPSNDWGDGFDALHDRSAVWAAVLTGRTVLRSTGHGFCSVRDGAGRVLARASSFDGPTVLVVDAPIG